MFRCFIIVLCDFVDVYEVTVDVKLGLGLVLVRFSAGTVAAEFVAFVVWRFRFHCHHVQMMN